MFLFQISKYRMVVSWLLFFKTTIGKHGTNANGSSEVRDVNIRDVACIEALYKFSPTYVYSEYSEYSVNIVTVTVY
jgi:hypothetical protein